MYEYVLPDGVTTLSSSSALPEAMSRATKASGVTFTPIGVAGSEGTADGGAYAYVSLESGDEDMWSGYREVAVATPEQLAAWGVELSPTEADALARGDALVGAASRLDPDGTVRLVVDAETEDGSPSPSKRVVLDGATADLGLGAVPQGQEPEIARVVISPEVARTNGIPVSSMVAIADRSAGPLTTGQRRDIRAAVKGVSEGPYLYTERGFQETYTLQLLLLLGAGGLAVLIGTLTATGLALVDARPDFATLAAVGAAPRTRRIVAAAQAAVLGVLGALLGVAVGFAPGLAATWPLTSERWGSLAGTDTGPIIAIPWGVLAAIVLIVPMVAAVASAVFTRGTLPLARRLAQ